MAVFDKQEIGRTDKALKNVKVAAICQIVYMIVGFICKTVFTNILGKDYAGVNGVLGNILSMLSFVELGMGNAIVYRLYEPVRKHEHCKICQYMRLYKKIYMCIALLILGIGLSIMPFLKYIIHAPSVKESLYLIYFLFLINTCVSYAFMHKKQILIADQKTYITSMINICTMAAANIINILFLFFFHNFIIYLIIQALFTFLDNIICALIADKQYPYISVKNDYGSLPKKETKSFSNDVKGLFLQKCAATAFGSTDNIFISYFLGVAVVGIVGQYLTLLGIFNLMLTSVFASVTASVGNLCIEETSADYKYDVFKKIYFMNALLSSYICLLMLLLERLFVTEIWYDNSFALKEDIVFLMVAEWYLRQLHYPIYLFRTAGGYFSKLKWIPGIAAVLNIVLDFALGKSMGLCGIFIVTLITRCIVRQADTTIVYRYIFDSSILKYYKIHLKHLLLSIVLFLLLRPLIMYADFTRWTLLLYGAGLVTVSYAFISLILFNDSDELQYLKNILKNQMKFARN